MRWSTLADTRLTKRSGWLGQYSLVLSYDPTRPAVYPENGRTLTDDVVDFFLPLLSNGKVTQDKVGPHQDLLAGFPYVGAPHKDRSAERLAA